MSPARMMGNGVTLTLCLYGCFLAACGYCSARSQGFAPEAMESLLMGVRACIAVWVCALCCSRGSKAPCVTSLQTAVTCIPTYTLAVRQAVLSALLEGCS